MHDELETRGDASDWCIQVKIGDKVMYEKIYENREKKR